MKKIILMLLVPFIAMGFIFGQKGQQIPVKDVDVINFFNKTNYIINLI